MKHAFLSLPSRWLLVSLCVSLPCLATGCGESRGKVAGKVTMSNGEPLPGGTITFVPVSGKGNIASTSISPDGKYELEVPSGECKISVDNRNVGKTPPAPIGAGGGGNAPPPGVGGAGVKTGPPGGMGGAGVKTGPPGGGAKAGPPQDKGGDIEKRMKDSGQAPTGAGSVQPGTYKPINPKYYDPETSGLTFGVKSGSQTFDITLNP